MGGILTSGEGVENEAGENPPSPLQSPRGGPAVRWQLDDTEGSGTRGAQDEPQPEDTRRRRRKPTLDSVRLQHSGHMSRIERSLVLARSQLSEMIHDAELSEDYLERLRECDQCLRSIEATLGCSKLANSLGNLLEADDGMPAMHSTMSIEVRSWLKNSYTDEADEDEGPEFGKEYSRGSQELQGSSASSGRAGLRLSPEVEELLSRVGKFDMDVLAVAGRPEVAGKTLTALLSYVLQDQQLLSSLPEGCCREVADTAALQERLYSFMSAADEAYLDTPYHNNSHAADVMMMMHWFFQSQYMRLEMNPFDHFMSLIAAAVHDMGHDGVNNMFHVKTHSQVAVRYNDRSVLENMHVAMAFEIMRDKEEHNWFSLLNPRFQCDPETKAVDLQLYMRKGIIEMVLMTDTVRHDKLMAGLEDLVAKSTTDVSLGSSSSPSSAPSHGNTELQKPAVFEKKQTTLKVLLHAADVSNPTRPLPIALEWSRRILLEFWGQGDEERRLGLEVSPLCDRTKGMASVPQGQLGFINFIVKPLFRKLSVLIPEVTEATDQLDSNVRFWEQKKEDGAQFTDIFPENDDADKE